MDDDCPGSVEHMQVRVAASLDGDGISMLEESFRELVAVLRSDQPLIRPLRQSLASALERGQIGSPGVRVRIEADAGYFKALGSIASNKKLLDAGRHIESEALKGRSYASIYRDDLPDMFGVTDTTDYGRRARELFEEFKAFCASPSAPSPQAWMTQADANDPLTDDDYYYVARAAFAERRVDFDTKWPAGG